MTSDGEIAAAIRHLGQHGYVVVPSALNGDECDAIDAALRRLLASGSEYGQNDVGTLWLDEVLADDRDRFAPLVAHPSVAPLLWAIGGRQIQLRSLRGHLYPGAYQQHWHMDFYGFWDQEDEGAFARASVAVNTTFYLQDGGPDTSRLELVRGGHLSRPGGLTRVGVRATEENDFTRWCEAQPRVVLEPRRGDCVVFFSHMPHRGLKVDPASWRSNVVCHYQLTPFYPGVWFLSEELGDQGIYPFVEGPPF
jgi:hypothetical protein